MATEKIRIEYEVIRKQIEEASKSLKELEKQTDLTEDASEQLTEKTKKQNKELASTNKLLTGLGGQLKATANRINIMGVGVGDLGANLVSSARGVGGMTKALKVLKIAIASTGIGLLVIALGSLVTFFTKTQRGADQASRAFAAIGGAIDVVIDRVSRFGEGIVLLFSGDVKEAVEIFRTALDGIGEEIQREAGAASTLEGALQRVRDAEIELNIERAKSRARIKELNLIAEDITKTDQQRADAAREAIQIEQGLLERQIELQQKRVAIITEQNRQGNSLTQNLEKEAEARITLANIQESSLELQTTLNNKLNIIEQQRLTKQLKTAEALKKQKEELQLIQAQYEELQKTDINVEGKDSFLKALFPSKEDIAKGIETVNEGLKKGREKANEIKAKADEEEKRKREEIGQELFNQSISFANKIFENKINNSQREFEALELQKEAELALAGDNAEGRAAIEAKFAAKAVEIKKKQAQDEKKGAIFESIINTAVAVTKTLANPILAAIIGAVGAAQTAAIASQPIPKFKKGGIIKGNSHDLGGVLIEAEGGEAILNRSAVNKYGKDTIDRMNKLEFDSSKVTVDTKPIADELKRRPEVSLSWNEKGFTSYLRNKNTIVARKSKKYAV